MIKMSQFYELMVFVSLMFLPCGLFIRAGVYKIVWFGGWGFIAAAFFYLAYRNSSEAIRISLSTKFILRDKLFETLKAAQVPKDVVASLRKIKGEKEERIFEGEHRFFSAMKRSLGSERTREVMHLVFKYAKE
jgi:hypothetical protein